MSATTDKPMTRVGVQPPSSTAGTGRGASMIGALVLLATVQLMVVLDTTIVNVALPTIQAGVGFSAPGIAWVVNGYALTFGALLLLGGRSGDLLGRRSVFMASLAAFAAASMVAGLSSSPGLLTTAGPTSGPPGPSPPALPPWPRSCCWSGAAPSRLPRCGCSPTATGAAPT